MGVVCLHAVFLQKIGDHDNREMFVFTEII